MSENSEPVSREEEILRAAYDVFTEKGFHGATMLEVAKRARASKATLYARFASKEGLFRALLDWGCRQTMADLRAIAEDAGRDPRQALVDYATMLLTTITSAGAVALLRIAIAEGGRQPEIGRIYNSLTRDPNVAMMGLLVERLVQAGVIAIDDPAEFRRGFIGILRGDLFYQALLGTIQPPEPAEVEAWARQSTARLLKAFAPEK